MKLIHVKRTTTPGRHRQPDHGLVARLRAYVSRLLDGVA